MLRSLLDTNIVIYVIKRRPLAVLGRFNDLHIAAHARSEGLIPVSNNLKEFARVPALQFENWIEAD